MYVHKCNVTLVSVAAVVRTVGFEQDIQVRVTSHTVSKVQADPIVIAVRASVIEEVA